MKKIKVFYNYILVRLKIRKILPSYYIKKIKVIENNEELVRIDLDKDIIISSRLKKPVYLRKKVYEKLKIFSKELKQKNLKIKLYDAYRSYEDQKKSWDRRYKETKSNNPNLDAAELERLTKLKVSKITSIDNVGGHQTGGAIDITLVDKNGKELKMGTEYSEHNDKTKTSNKELTKEEKENRELLVKSLEKLGFVNYPNEWWHFCYGDKMWAAYKYKKNCPYGYIEPK